MHSRTRIALIAVLLLLPLAAAQAVPLHWTAAGSTGVVDPTFNGGGYVFTGAGVSPVSTTPTLLLRYNVVNPTGTETPAWTTLEMGYTDTGSGGGLSARLMQVDTCTGNVTEICSVNSTTATGSCRSCTFANTTINFGTKVYYVQVSLVKSTTTPTLYTLRLF
jgi:hypothetical protein